jgi:UDP-GlcNAc:undecaprenyl-phosphate GlcNAc-1-phosphate transferase
MNAFDVPVGLAIAAAVTLLVTPFVARVARQIGVIDQPRPRGLHEHATPRLGGIGILTGVIVASIFVLPLDQQTLGILFAALAITLVGSLDDARDLRPQLKLLGQFLVALVPVISGVRVETMTLPFIGHIYFGPVLGGILTLVGIVAVMNVVNFTDGVDGLAAGVCTIAAVTFAIIALSLGRDSAAGLAAITAGAAIGFLRHNFHPASVFMGDSGSNLLGLLLACVAVQGLLKTAAVVTLVFPLVILAVPILDTGFVVAKRIKYRRPVYEADRWHFHHRFANIGFSQRRTVVYLYGWTVTLSALALAVRFIPYSDHHGHFFAGWLSVVMIFALVAFAASVYLVYVLEILKFRRFREGQLRRVAAERGSRQPSEHEIEAEVAREVETGEFHATAE